VTSERLQGVNKAMFTIQCPDCSAETSLSLDQLVYEGPYRCWKCRGLFKIKIGNKKLQTCEPLSEEELEQQMDSS
jgi:hypothetical protein